MIHPLLTYHLVSILTFEYVSRRRRNITPPLGWQKQVSYGFSKRFEVLEMDGSTEARLLRGVHSPMSPFRDAAMLSLGYPWPCCRLAVPSSSRTAF